MAVRAKFLNDFSEICSQFPEHYSIYSVHDVKNSFGITYSELDRLSDELSRYFVKIIGTGTQYVGIEAYDNFLIPSLILGIWKSGYSFVGIGTQYALKDTVNCLNALGVQYVIVDKNYTRCIENNAEIISSFQIHQQKLYLWRRKIQTKEKYKEDWDMCYGVMTSGTTGLLKIIQVPWSCILLNIEELMEEFQVNENDCILLASPFTFDPFFVELFLSLLSGCSLLTVPNTIKLCSTVLLHILFDTDNIGNEVLENPPHKNHQMDNNFCLNVERVRRKPITILQMTPSMFKNWTDDVIKNIILSSNTLLRILILGGESFPTEILKLRCKNNKTRIFNIYGITEISCWSFCYEITDEFSESQVPLGKALKNIIYKINSSDELIIGSSTRVCLINDEMKFKSGELRFRSTGDIVQLTNGKLYFVSRTNQIIKKFGIKINLEKIEKLFLNSNKSFKACFCVYDKFNMKLGLFYCVPNGNLTEHIKIISFENFIKLGYHYPNSELKDIEKPDYLIEISKVPLNSHGKCDKNELLKHLTNIHCDSKLCLEVENRFKCIWKNVLGLTDSDETSKSFTELGGNSILALQLINKLEDDGIAVQPNFIIKLLNGDSKESCFKSLSNFLLTGTPAKKRKLPEEVIKDDSIELKLKWKFDFGKCIDSTPTVFTADGNEKLVVGSHSTKLAAIDSDSGKFIWTIFLGDRIESGVAVTKDGTRGFVGCYDSFVYCVLMTNGSVIWKHKTNDMIKSTPCLSSNEKILFVASYDRCLYCLSVDSGAVLKKLKVSEKGIFSSGVTSALLNTFYLATLDGSCLALCQTSHEIKWKKKLESPVFASPCLIKEDKILFAEVLGILHCLNAVDGALIWKFSANGFVYSTPIHHKFNGISYIIFGCNDSCLYCLQYTDDIKLVWKGQLDSAIFARPCVFPFNNKRVVCAATTKGFIYLCDFSSGAVQTSFKLEGEVFSSPVYGEKELFVGCRDNYLYALNILKNRNI